MPLGKAAAENALRLDPDLALGHTILGIVHAAYEFDWERAEHSFQQAIELQPGLALAYQMRARSLLAQSRPDEAIAALDRALSLNAFDATLRATAILAYSVTGDYPAAMQSYVLGVEISPKSSFVHISMGLAHLAAGESEKAISAFRIACAVPAADRSYIALAALGNALARSGDRGGAEALLKEVSAAPWTNSLPLSILHLGLGNTIEALRWLDRAIEDRDSHVIFTPVDPRFADWRGNPRFESLLARMSLSPSLRICVLDLKIVKWDRVAAPKPVHSSEPVELLVGRAMEASR